MTTFEKTHPWISFRLDMHGASPALWMMLGEAASKCEHIAAVPLQPETARRMLQLYLAKGAAATTAIDYAPRTLRTLARDLVELERMDLVERTPEGIRAKREVILAFLPWRKRKA